MIHNSGRWGRVSMVSSLAVGPKGTLPWQGFMSSQKKKKTKQREYILGYSKYLKFISF